MSNQSDNLQRLLKNTSPKGLAILVALVIVVGGVSWGMNACNGAGAVGGTGTHTSTTNSQTSGSLTGIASADAGVTTGALANETDDDRDYNADYANDTAKFWAAVGEYSGTDVVEINNSTPSFTEEEIAQAKAAGSFEEYSELDRYGRCGTAYANVGEDLMPSGERDRITSVKPTGWHSTKYADIDGENIYNRSHLIAYQLTGESANWRNLVTGTRYMNSVTMLPYEEEAGDYVRETGKHVLYRVTPVFVGEEKVCRGLHMEAYSLEDNGKGVSYNIFCYNVQPGYGIDYASGDTWSEE